MIRTPYIPNLRPASKKGADLFCFCEIHSWKSFSTKQKLASPAVPEGVWLCLPDSTIDEEGRMDEIRLTLRELKVKTVQACRLLDVRCSLPELSVGLDEYQDLADLIYDGNDLGYVLQEQGQGEPRFLAKFRAALEYEQCHDLKLALDIAANLNCYDYGQDITLEIAEIDIPDIDGLSNSDFETAYELTMSYGGRNISSLGGDVTITVPWNEDVGYAYYVDGDELSERYDMTVSGGDATWITDHRHFGGKTPGLPAAAL